MKVWILFVLVLFLACERLDELRVSKSSKKIDTARSVNPPKQESLCTEECEEKSTTQELIFPQVDFIASNRAHSFFLSNGLLYGWGDNEFQQLWQSPLSYWDEPQLAPVELQQLQLRQLFLGKNFTLALNDKGELFAWGDNTFGQLASYGGSEGYRRIKLPTIEKVTVGGSHVLALTKDGLIYSWGANLVGQLGRGSKQSLKSSQNRQRINTSALPARVSGLDKVELIAAGESHSLALDNQGVVYGWGLSTFGALGADVIGSLIRVPTTLNSSNVIDAEFVQVPTIIKLPQGVTQLSAGSAHSLALVAGKVYSWGLNDQGQLGRASSNAKKYTVYQLKDSGEVKVKLLEVNIDPMPQVIEELTNIIAISSRGNSSFALDATGQLYFWGGNFSRPQGMPLYQVWRIDQLSEVKDIAAAGNASLLLLDKESHPFYWGVFRSLQAITVEKISSESPLKKETSPKELEDALELVTEHQDKPDKSSEKIQTDS